MSNQPMKRPPFSLSCSTMTTYWAGIALGVNPDLHPQAREAMENVAADYFELHVEHCNKCADAATLTLNGLREGDAHVVRGQPVLSKETREDLKARGVQFPVQLEPREDDK